MKPITSLRMRTLLLFGPLVAVLLALNCCSARAATLSISASEMNALSARYYSVVWQDKTLNPAVAPPHAQITAHYPSFFFADKGASKVLSSVITAKISAEQSAFLKQQKVARQGDPNMPPFTTQDDQDQITYVVFHSSPQLVSVLFHELVFLAGAAHPSTTNFVINYDVAHHKGLNLSDLFQRKTDFLNQLSGLATARLVQRFGDSKWVRGGASAKAANYSAWNLTGYGILITFGQYQVAPYSNGMPQVIVPLSKLSHLSKAVKTLTEEKQATKL